MSQRKNHSVVWDYFEKGENYRAVCNTCKEMLSYKSTTANLRNHIQRKHPDLYREFPSRPAEKSENRSVNLEGTASTSTVLISEYQEESSVSQDARRQEEHSNIINIDNNDDPLDIKVEIIEAGTSSYALDPTTSDNRNLQSDYALDTTTSDNRSRHSDYGLNPTTSNHGISNSGYGLGPASLVEEGGEILDTKNLTSPRTTLRAFRTQSTSGRNQIPITRKRRCVNSNFIKRGVVEKKAASDLEIELFNLKKTKLVLEIEIARAELTKKEFEVKTARLVYLKHVENQNQDYVNFSS